MLEKEKLCRNVVEIINTDQLVPPDHLLRRIDAAAAIALFLLSDRNMKIHSRE
jgi:hypothetical protein